MKGKYPVQTGKGSCGGQLGAGMSSRHIPERSPSPPSPCVFPCHLISGSSSAPFLPLPQAQFLLCPTQLPGLGGGGWPEPLGLSLYLDPANSPVFWCMSRWPLPSTCSGCALEGVGQENLALVTLSLPSMHHCSIPLTS